MLRALPAVRAAGLTVCGGLAAILPAAGATVEDGRAEGQAEIEETIEVVALAPADSTGVPWDQVPANVQQSTAEEVEAARSLALGDFLSHQLGSVQINDVQNNPFQPDVRFRGFTASPLLGSAQGLAVYHNGVRLNEPFGDTVSWDLVPLGALASVDLLPGSSSPLYGRNALGAALALESKSGFSSPGHRLRLAAASFGARQLELESGFSRGDWGFFAAANAFREDGWRDFSPSEVRQLYARLGHRSRRATFDLDLTLADTELRGNGAVPVQLLQERREAVFTHPDVTENRLFFPTLTVGFEATPRLFLEMILFYRDNDVSTFNGDLREDEDEEEDEEDEEDDPFDGANNTTATDQGSWGLNLQATRRFALGGRPGRAAVGLTFDRSVAKFRSATELATLTADRGTVGSGILDPDAAVEVDARPEGLGLFATTTFSPAPSFALTLSARWDRNRLRLEDRLGTELSGDHEFERFNPALGFTWRFAEKASLYASYGESSRAPTPVELTCADPEDPCRLPNAFVADPPLEQVVTRTWEAGVRGDSGRMRWHAGLFRATNDADLIFVSSGRRTNAGFFDNVGRTRRQGLELGVRGSGPRRQWFLYYTWLDATFETALRLPSPNHPEAIEGEIEVEPGDRLPGTSEHQFKAGLRLELGEAWTVAATLIHNSEQFFRGDEGNQVEPVSDYAVVDLDLSYRLSQPLTLVLEVGNLFDREYENFGVFGEADEVLGEDFEDPRFLGPGAPRSVRLALEFAL